MNDNNNFGQPNTPGYTPDPTAPQPAQNFNEPAFGQPQPNNYGPQPAPQYQVQPQYQQATQYQAASAYQQVDPQPYQPTAPLGPAPYEQPAYAPAPQTPQKRSKKPFILAGVIALIIALGGTYTFAFYIPSRPENVWNASLGNTGKALTSLNGTLTSSANTSKLSKQDVEGTFTATAPGDASLGEKDTTYSGKLSLKSDGAKVNAAINASVANGSQSYKLDVNVLSNQVANSAYPDVFLQVNGIKDLGLDALIPGISTYDGTWISIPSSYLTQTLDSSGTTKPSTSSVTSKDVTEFTNAVSGVITKDVLTADASKSLLERKSFVGREKKNDRDSYHYTATVNQDRAADLCKDLDAAITPTQLYKKVGSGDSSSTNIKDCTDYFSKNFPNTKTIDVWMDSSYHVVSAIRFNPGDTAGEYAEFGEKLGDLNKPTLYFTSSKKSGTQTTTVSLDKSTLVLTGDLAYTDNADTGATKVTAHVTATPYTGTITVTPPTKSTDIQDVFTKLLGTSDFGSSFDTTDTSISTT